jgi:hypothetical protein
MLGCLDRAQSPDRRHRAGVVAATADDHGRLSVRLARVGSPLETAEPPRWRRRRGRRPARIEPSSSGTRIGFRPWPRSGSDRHAAATRDGQCRSHVPQRADWPQSVPSAPVQCKCRGWRINAMRARRVAPQKACTGHQDKWACTGVPRLPPTAADWPPRPFQAHFVLSEVRRQPTSRTPAR